MLHFKPLYQVSLLLEGNQTRSVTEGLIKSLARRRVEDCSGFLNCHWVVLAAQKPRLGRYTSLLYSVRFKYLSKWTPVYVLFVCLFVLYSIRPAVRALPSKQMFEHMMKRHDVLFVYVGGDSPLKVSNIHQYTFILLFFSNHTKVCIIGAMLCCSIDII